MAIITAKSEQLIKIEGLRHDPLKSNENEGRFRQKFFNFNTTDDLNGATLVDGATLHLVLLRKGSRVFKGRCWFEAMGTDQTADIGLIGADGSGFYDAAGVLADDLDFFTTAVILVAASGESDFGYLQEDNPGYELEKDCYISVTTLDSSSSDPWAADKDFDGYIVYVTD